MTLKTLVVGLGKIGMLYNFSIKKNKFSNHCDIFSNTKGFELIAGVDPLRIKRDLFKKKFNQPVFKDLDTACQKIKPDIIVISVSTTKVENIYKKIISLKIKPKAFILEKPGAYKSNILNSFFDYCKKNKINIFMNYTRNFSKKLNLFSKLLKDNKIGVINKIQIFYCKGLYNSCSHYINFLNNFFKFKKIRNIEVKNYIKKNNDFYANFSVQFKIQVDFILNKKKENEKINIIGSKGYIQYLTEKHKIFFFHKRSKKTINNDFKNDQKNMIDFVKKNFYLRTKCYKIFKQNILTLQIINQICQKF